MCLAWMNTKYVDHIYVFILVFYQHISNLNFPIWKVPKLIKNCIFIS